MEELLKHLGYATPFMYAAAAYALFHWLDENASQTAVAAAPSGPDWLHDARRLPHAGAKLEWSDHCHMMMPPLTTYFSLYDGNPNQASALCRRQRHCGTCEGSNGSERLELDGRRGALEAS